MAGLLGGLSAPAADYPEVPDACYRKLGQPVTFTSAAVTMSYQPARNQQPAVYGLNLTLPAAETAALTAITTKAFDSRTRWPSPSPARPGASS